MLLECNANVMCPFKKCNGWQSQMSKDNQRIAAVKSCLGLKWRNWSYNTENIFVLNRLNITLN